jgi:hypothetical protein
MGTLPLLDLLTGLGSINNNGEHHKFNHWLPPASSELFLTV